MTERSSLMIYYDSMDKRQQGAVRKHNYPAESFFIQKLPYTTFLKGS